MSASTNPDLTVFQKAEAKKLLAKRPMTIPGTRAIIEADRAKVWHTEVADAATRLQVSDAQFNAFMDACGVAD